MTAKLLPFLFAPAALAQPCIPAWHAHGVDGPVKALYIDDTTDTLYVGGDFQNPSPYITSLREGQLHHVGTGLGGEVLGITMHNDGTGRTLYASGVFNIDLPVGSTGLGRLAQGRFEAFGTDGIAHSWFGHLVSYDLGGGPRLVVTGGFGFPCDYAAEWTGARWQCMGAGLGTTYEDALIFDDGSGPAVYFVGGLLMLDFPFGEGFGIGRWNGDAWSVVGGGINGLAHGCAIYDSGEGPELVIAGGFPRAGGQRVNHIARWNGTRWATLGSGFNRDATAIATFDDGSGPKLYVAGRFTAAGDVPVDRLARWDGSRWSACPSGGFSAGDVNRMRTFDPDGDGPARPSLFFGGAFTRTGSSAVEHLAELTPGLATADLTRDNFVDFFDYDLFVGLFETGDPAADRTGDRFLDFFDYDDFVVAFESGC